MLHQEQLQLAIASAKRRFDLIRQRYPGLKGNLVLSLPGVQTGIDSPPAIILSESPAIVINDDAKRGALGILSRLKALQAEGASDKENEQLQKQRTKLKDQFDQLASGLRYDERCQVEIRFKIRNDNTGAPVSLDYNLIWKLQADELVDRNLTPQNKASIRIVLGTLFQFSPDNQNHTCRDNLWGHSVPLSR